MFTLREKWSIIVDILEVDLDIRVAHEAIAALVLSKHSESPLGPAIGLISVQRLQ